MMNNDTSALNSEINRLRLEIKSLKAETGVEDVSVGNYLLKRLEQLGVTAMFGVPGDFNLGFLDLVEDHPTIDWVGNCNELNAAYAADGYARVKESSIGVVTTTFGVGELSATNGIAGAFSEMVPVLHIVGVPSTVQQKNRPLLHHTLGDGRYDAYQKAAKQFTIHESILFNKANAAEEIDAAITQCITKARPVYIALPTDLVNQHISAERLSIPLSNTLPINKPEKEKFVIDRIEQLINEADGDAVVLVDACVMRHGVRKEVLGLLHQTGFPVYATPMGKTAIDESYERYGGTYIGSISFPEIKERVEAAKVVLTIGLLSSDFNTGNFSYNFSTQKLIELHSDHTKLQYATFEGVAMKHLLPKLAARLKHFAPEATKIPVAKHVLNLPRDNSPTITQDWFWAHLSGFFQEKDVIITETGTANFGIMDVSLPKNSMLLSQILWGSIGWSVGCTLGAALGAREIGMERVILFVGEGSLQLTVQELSPMIHKGLKPIIFVINNKGYTIERFIHGKHRHYNDVANWKWTSLLETFKGSSHIKTASYIVKEKEDLVKLLNNKSFAKADCIQLVEVIMDPLDAPRALHLQTQTSERN